MSGQRRLIGFFGGTFDPIHSGHLRLAEEAITALGLDRVIFSPAGVPTHRAPARASAQARLEMVRLAIADNPRFELDDTEALQTTPAYTVPTLERLRAQLPKDTAIVLLLGADAYLGIPGWHRWKEVFTLAHIAVASRPGYVLEDTAMPDALRAEVPARSSEAATALLKTDSGCVAHFDITALMISATALRAAIASDQSVRYLLPDSVRGYIESAGLYLTHTGSHGR